MSITANLLLSTAENGKGKKKVQWYFKADSYSRKINTRIKNNKSVHSVGKRMLLQLNHWSEAPETGIPRCVSAEATWALLLLKWAKVFSISSATEHRATLHPSFIPHTCRTPPTQAIQPAGTRGKGIPCVPQCCCDKWALMTILHVDIAIDLKASWTGSVQHFDLRGEQCCICHI